MNNKNSIRINNLSFAYRNKEIFENVNLEIKSGEVVAIIGDNGCGKTTLLKLITKFIFPKRGEILLDIEKDNNKPVMSGFLENPKVWKSMTGKENVKYYLGKYYNEKMVDAMFKEWRLDNVADELVNKYSLGMRQRLGLIIAFATNSDILVLDEPTNSLDQNSIGLFHDYLHKAQRNGRIIVFTTHTFYGLDKICTRILKIKDGKITQNDEVEKKERVFSVIFCDKLDVDSVKNLLSDCIIEIDEKRIKVCEKNMTISQIIRELSVFDICEVHKEFI